MRSRQARFEDGHRVHFKRTVFVPGTRHEDGAQSNDEFAWTFVVAASRSSLPISTKWPEHHLRKLLRR
jgi:hypothetical protein